MTATENACLSYVKKWVDINFTGDTVCCARCPLLETYARKQCRRTGEYIMDDRVTGYWCPLCDHPGTVGHVPEEFLRVDENGEVLNDES